MNPNQQHKKHAAPSLPLVESQGDARLTMADVEAARAEADAAKADLVSAQDTIATLRREMEDAHAAIATLAGERDDLAAKARDAARDVIADTPREPTIGDLASTMTRANITSIHVVARGARLDIQAYRTPFPDTQQIAAIVVNGDSLENALGNVAMAGMPN